MCGSYHLTIDAGLREMLNRIAAQDMRTTSQTTTIIEKAATQPSLPGDWPKDDGQATWTPGRAVPALLAPDGKLTANYLLWGFPTFAGKHPVINARSETAAIKPLFAESLSLRRCVLPADAFYERDVAGKRYRFQTSDNTPFLIAAVYAPYEDGLHCCVLTRAAQGMVRHIHDRMPVMISEKDLATWLLDARGAKRLLSESAPLLSACEDPLPKGAGKSDGQESLW